MTTASITSNRFQGIRQPQWEKLGIKIDDEQESIDDTLTRAGIDYQYHTLDLWYQTPEGTHGLSKNRIVLREPTREDNQWQEMGIVGPTYTYLQNKDLLTGVRHLQRETGWQLDSIGSIGAGGTVFFVMKAEKRNIFGDQLQTYVILHDARAQRRSLAIAISPLRLRCMNQLSGGGLDLVAMPHRPGIEHEFAFWTKTLGRLQKQQVEIYNQLEAMASVKIDDSMARTIIEKAYPLPRVSKRAQNLVRVWQSDGLAPDLKREVEESIEEANERQAKARDQVYIRRHNAFELYERFNVNEEYGAKEGPVSPQTMDHLIKTPYAVMQAVTELIDWGGQAAGPVAAGSALFGEGVHIKQRTWKACLGAIKE